MLKILKKFSDYGQYGLVVLLLFQGESCSTPTVDESRNFEDPLELVYEEPQKLVENVSFGDQLSDSTKPLPSSFGGEIVTGENIGDVEISHFQYDDREKRFEQIPVQITSNFAIPNGLEKRVWFWGQIYSYFSINEYVLHIGDYPEVVLEVGKNIMTEDGTSISGILKTKRAMNKRKRRYAAILRKMHRNKSKSFNTPQMKRIENAMIHIDDRNKYLKAANSVRTQRGQKEFVGRGIVMASEYLPHIVKEFEQRSLPVELAKIAFVESSFNIKAVSKVGASGVYQIMPFIGRKFLVMNRYIDERRDPIKSSIAAARLFQENYRGLGNWPLSVTAYNHGLYGIRRAVRKVGSEDLAEIIKNYNNRRFGFASKNFYSEFLAMLYTLENSSTFFPNLELKPEISFENRVLQRSSSIKGILKTYNITAEDLIKLNPDINSKLIKRNGRIRKGYILKIPKKPLSSPVS
jgi:membrane-bound lytic murein transglycosylase D